MNIRQLTYFLNIADEGHITSAAAKLNISQPSLSNQLRQLEEELGVQLFERRNKAMVLTNEGRMLAAHAKKILREYEGTLSEIEDLKRGKGGQLKIATIGSGALGFLPDALSGFMKQTPDIDLQIFEVDVSLITGLLENNTAELAVTRGAINSEIYNQIPIISSGIRAEDDYICLVSQPSFFEGESIDSIDFSSLEDKPLIVHRAYQEWTTRTCEQHGFHPHYICTDENVMTSLFWARQGLGVALMPKSSAVLIKNFEGGDRMLIHSLNEPAFLPSRLIWKKDSYISPLAQAFITYVGDMGKE